MLMPGVSADVSLSHEQASVEARVRAIFAQDILGRVVKGLGLGVSDRVVAHPDPRTALRAVLRAWLPLSEAVLGAAVDQLPSPVVRCQLPQQYVQGCHCQGQLPSMERRA